MQGSFANSEINHKRKKKVQKKKSGMIWLIWYVHIGKYIKYQVFILKNIAQYGYIGKIRNNYECMFFIFYEN